MEILFRIGYESRFMPTKGISYYAEGQQHGKGWGHTSKPDCSHCKPDYKNDNRYKVTYLIEKQLLIVETMGDRNRPYVVEVEKDINRVDLSEAYEF